MKQTLVSLLETWREHRQPEVGDLVEALTATLLAGEARAAIGAKKKAADRTLWRDIAKLQDPLDFPRLMQSARGGSQVDVKLQVQYLSGWNHPSMARGLLELLEEPPYAGIKSRPMLEEIFEALQNTRDVRLVKPARVLAKRYLAIVNSGTGGWIVSELERVAKIISEISPPPISEKERGQYEAIVQSLPAEHRPKKQAKDSGPDLDVLLAEVFAHPEDDEKRLAFANAVEKEDPERAEFIRLQVASSRGAIAPEQSARMKELGTDARLAGWAQPISMSGYCEFRRGFPWSIRLYKTALKSIGENAWATIEQVDGVGALSQKAAVELLDHPNLANVKRVSSISSKVLAALENRKRPWTALTLSEDIPLDKQLLQRVPEVRELFLRLPTNRETHEPQLLWELSQLQHLEMRVNRECKGIVLGVPPTVIEANIHGDTAPGIFAHAKKLNKLTYWPGRVTKANLEGLDQLKILDIHADNFAADSFEATPNLVELKVSLSRSNGVLPKNTLAPLKKLRMLDLGYTRVEAGELGPLERMEEVQNHWLDVDGVPSLPKLKVFHCMLPSQVAEIEGLLQRNPTLRQVDFCWNSSSELWFYGDPPAKVEKPWENFAEVMKQSSVESWGYDKKLRIVRQKNKWRIEVEEKPRIPDYGLQALLTKIAQTFEISESDIAPELRIPQKKR